MLGKIINCQSFKNSQENVEDGVYFSKVASLQTADCTSTINRFRHRFFSENVPKLIALKEHFSISFWCSIVLIGCGPAVHSPQFCQNLSSR